MATTLTPGSTYKVQPNDTLSKIAGNFYSNPDLWFRIYKYTPNQTQIDKAQSGSKFIPATSTLKKDLSLYIPPLPKPGFYYTVLQGDTLWDIAHAAYGDGKQDSKISNNPRNRPPISDPNQIQPGWVLFIPPLTSASLPPTSVSPTPTAGSYYKVKPGDTLSKIAGIAYPDDGQWQRIANHPLNDQVIGPNPSGNSSLKEGVIFIPQSSNEGFYFTAPKGGTTLSEIAYQVYRNEALSFRISKYTPNQTQIDKPDQVKEGKTIFIPLLPKPGSYYTVLQGDTLWDIANAAYGDGKQDSKISSNPQNRPPISDPNQIQPGWVLFIPPKS